MPVLFVFLFKVNIALLLFCAGYYLVLRHLTFYTLNRVYLLAAIVVSTLYPKINLLAFAQRHEQLVKPVAFNWQLLVQPVAEPAYWRWITVVFWIGAALLTVRLIFQLLSLFKLYNNSSPALINNQEVRVMSKDTAPFSFWKSIYVNPDKHEPADLKAILLHEQVHVNQWHTLDILLAEISTIFYWFNPGIWLIKKAVRENIEFITDQKILNKGIDSKTYQYSLVNVSFNNGTHSIVNHFNISTIKKRIIMMNAKRSSRFNLTRYALVLPVVFALLLVFSVSKADFAKPVRLRLAKALNINFDKSAKTGDSVVRILAITPSLFDKKKNDTTRVKFANKAKSDSMIYIVDGVRTDFKDLDVTKNVAVVALWNDYAKPYLNSNDNKNACVLVITTKDSPEGKALLEKRKRTIANKAKLIMITDAVIDPRPKENFTGLTVRTNPYPSTKTVNKPSPTADQPNINLTSTVVRTDPYSTSTAATSASSTTNDKSAAPRRFSIGVTSSATIDQDNANNKVVILTSTSSKTNADGSPRVAPGSIAVTVDKTFDIKTSDGKTPLVIVDSKEVAPEDLKKIDPVKISTLKLLKDEPATEKYGDKARDGVVEITTLH